MVAQSEVDAMVFAEPVGALITTDPQPVHVDQDLHLIQIVAGLFTEQFVMCHRQTVYLVDAATDGARQLESSAEHFSSRPHHVSTPAVQRGIDRHARAGGHQQVRAL